MPMLESASTRSGPPSGVAQPKAERIATATTLPEIAPPEYAWPETEDRPPPQAPTATVPSSAGNVASDQSFLPLPAAIRPLAARRFRRPPAAVFQGPVANTSAGGRGKASAGVLAESGGLHGEMHLVLQSRI